MCFMSLKFQSVYIYVHSYVTTRFSLDFRHLGSTVYLVNRFVLCYSRQQQQSVKEYSKNKMQS
jgi:hypothetical protein